MDFFEKNMKDTLEAINNSIDNNIFLINTKRIRKYHNINSSNRSKINFIWRALRLLEERGVLIPNGATNPRSYKIKIRKPIDIIKYIENLDKGSTIKQ